jgi:hypothetical protein
MEAADSVRPLTPTMPPSIEPAAAYQARRPAASTITARSSEAWPLKPTAALVP